MLLRLLVVAVALFISAGSTPAAEARTPPAAARGKAKAKVNASSKRTKRPRTAHTTVGKTWGEALKVKPRRIVGPNGNPIAALPAAPTGARRIVFGVMGGAGEKVPVDIDAKIEKLGGEIAGLGNVTLTGACTGFPESAARGARARGGLTVGISSYRTLKAHSASGSPTDFDVLQLTQLPPSQRGQVRPNYIGREIDNIERSDVIVIVGGRSGTLAEFAIAIEEQRPIGVLTGSGGVADLARDIVKALTKAGKPPSAPIVYDSNPVRLIRRLERAYRRTAPRVGPLGDG
jgi:predicted Rossmann-fold nucleotide-binding protein